jgi:ribosome-binding factor A
VKSRRLERVSEELRAEIARVLREEVADPRVAMVTVLRVDTSPDLRNALVFWSRIERKGGPEIASIEADSRAPRVSCVGVSHRSPMKRMPALTFRYDPDRGGDRTWRLRELSDEPTE